MGILDDAIREHLELKRRRGADPNEMERLEREALGPVRRGPQEAGVDEPGPPASLDEVPTDWPEQEPQAESATEVEPQLEPHLEADDAAVGDSSLFDHEADGSPAPSSASAEEPPAPPVDVAPPAPEAPTTPVPAGDDYLGQETAEYDVEAEHALEPEGDQATHGADRPAAQGEHSDEDVLEETPEFLQDTPDHDRLWFEQRPPRDFDFDE